MDAEASALLLLLVCLLAATATTEPMADTDTGNTTAAPPMTRVELVRHLTDETRYNRLQRPLHGEAPLNVSAHSYIYMVQTIEGRLHLELRLTMKLALGFLDPRLRYAELSPTTWELAGDADLLRRLWTPHVFLANEQSSALLGAGPDHDVLVRVRPDGHVFFVTRFTVSVVCDMKYGRFPFDQQECALNLESWLDDADDLVLHWASKPRGDRLRLDSFFLRGWVQEAERAAKLNISAPDNYDLLDRFGGSYSRLKLTFSLYRQYGFFLMDYYVPSILLVVVSWVSFWLHPDIVPARVLIGASTMLTFITLAVQTDRALPVSYNKASEIWFVGCCTFIFTSLVEFAFVNTIWRHGQNVEVKKVSTKHILRSTLVGTPKPPRRRLLPQERYARRRTSSLPDLFKPHEAGQAGQAGAIAALAQAHHSYFNTIHAGTTLRPSPLASVCESGEAVDQAADDDVESDTVSEGGSQTGSQAESQGGGRGVTFDSAATLAAEEQEQRPRLPPQVAGTRRQSLSASLVAGLRQRAGGVSGYGHRLSVALTPAFTRMSASEVADWIDRRSRVFFPIAFFVFNVAYWVFVIWL